MSKLTYQRLSRSILLGLALLATSTLHEAKAAIWTGGGIDDEFSTPANWDSSAVPTAGSTQNINGVFIVERSVDSSAGRTFVQGGAVLNVTGGTHIDTQSGASTYNFVGLSSGSGVVNQSGGTYSIGHGLRIGVGAGTNSGTYNLSGGNLIIYRGSSSSIEPSNPGGRPSMEIGGTTGSGLLEISGGSLSTRLGTHIAPTGTFSVVGSGATSINIGPQNSGDGSWIQHGTLKASIDAGGITPIFVDDFDDAGGVVGEFKAGSELDLSFDGIAPAGGSWTLLTIENTDIVDGGLALSSGTSSNWSFVIDNSGDDGLLIVTYVPEPSAGSLLLIGSLFFVRKMRI